MYCGAGLTRTSLIDRNVYLDSSRKVVRHLYDITSHNGKPLVNIDRHYSNVPLIVRCSAGDALFVMHEIAGVFTRLLIHLRTSDLLSTSPRFRLFIWIIKRVLAESIAR